MKKNRMKDVFESIVQRDVPANANLWPRIVEKTERKNFMQTVRARPALALFLVLLALALLSSVAYAIGKVTGYIPGVGIVDQSTPLRVLAKPVVAERDGLTVTISEVVADSDHTFVAYGVDGIIARSGGWPVCTVMPSLQLPDGSTLNAITMDYGPLGGQVGSEMEFKPRAIYSSIPAGVSNLTITFPCILPEGTGPKNWQIPLQLSPAPKDYAIPAIEIGATFVASNPEFAMTPAPDGPSLSNTPTPVSNGSGLHLEKVIELPDSYILFGNFTDAGDLPGSLLVSDDDQLNIQDTNGNSVPYDVRDDIRPEVDRAGVNDWALEIAKPVQGPLTITLDKIDIVVSDTTQFKFDAGSNPQVGQKWELNLPVHLRKYNYVIDSVEVIKDGYLFKYHSVDTPEGMSLGIDILGSFPRWEDVRQITAAEYSHNLIFPDRLPTGQLTLELTLSEFIPLQGPWMLTWTPSGK